MREHAVHCQSDCGCFVPDQKSGNFSATNCAFVCSSYEPDLAATAFSNGFHKLVPRADELSGVSRSLTIRNAGAVCVMVW